MTKHFLVKDNHKILKIEEIAEKAFAITSEGTFKIRENTHSNTFLIYPSYFPILKIYELSPLNYREIYNCLPFSSFTEITWLETPFNPEELNTLKTKYFVLTKGSSIAKISYSDMIKTVQYIQSLNNLHDFNLFENLDDGKTIKSWAIECLNGSSNELGLFILLDCFQKNLLENFILNWKKSDLFDIDLKGFLLYLENSFLDKNERTKVYKLIMNKSL